MYAPAVYIRYYYADACYYVFVVTCNYSAYLADLIVAKQNVKASQKPPDHEMD